MTKQEVLKQLEYILKNIERAYNRAEKLSKKIDVPAHTELHLIKSQVEQLIQMGKEKTK